MILVAFAFVLGSLCGAVWQALHHYHRRRHPPRRHHRAVALQLVPIGDFTVETLVLGRPARFKVTGIDDLGADAPLPAAPTMAVDGVALPADADGNFTVTPAVASGNIVASCPPLPDLSDPYTASAAPAVALKITAL